MQKISAYILTFNEAEKIEAALSSVLWADEIVVVDSFSVDRTAQIARSLGARVVDVPFRGFGDLRNRAIEACQFEWIFSLDADERCTEAVRDEILALAYCWRSHPIDVVRARKYGDETQASGSDQNCPGHRHRKCRGPKPPGGE